MSSKKKRSNKSSFGEDGMVRFNTEKGELIVELNDDIGLFKESKKLFVSLVSNGFYENTKDLEICFDKLIPRMWIECGGRNNDVSKSTGSRLIRGNGREPTGVGYSMDGAGCFGLRNDGRFIISLDRCTAFAYVPIGRLVPSCLHVLFDISDSLLKSESVPIFSSSFLSSPPPEKKPKRPKMTPTPPATPKVTSIITRTGTELLSPSLSLGFGLASQTTCPACRSIPSPKYPLRLTIIRHGESQQNAELASAAAAALTSSRIDLSQASVRDADIALTSTGVRQAIAVGKYLSEGIHFHLTSNEESIFPTGEELPFDCCFSSPYLRAIQTAQNIINQLPSPIKIHKDNRLREKEFGPWHGLDVETVKEKFPREYELRMRDGKYWYSLPGGENYPAVELRVNSFLEMICRDFSGRSVLVVTHQVPYKLFRGLFQHLDEEGIMGLDNVPNCAIQEYVLDRRRRPEGKLKLKLWNHVAKAT